MPQSLRCIRDIEENVSDFKAGVGVKSIVNFMNNKIELMYVGVTGTEL